MVSTAAFSYCPALLNRQRDFEARSRRHLPTDSNHFQDHQIIAVSYVRPRSVVRTWIGEETRLAMLEGRSLKKIRPSAPLRPHLANNYSSEVCETLQKRVPHSARFWWVRRV